MNIIQLLRQLDDPENFNSPQIIGTIQYLAMQDRDQAVAAFFDEQLTDRERSGLYNVLVSGLAENPQQRVFVRELNAELNKRRTQLPENVLVYLDWLTSMI